MVPGGQARMRNTRERCPLTPTKEASAHCAPRILTSTWTAPDVSGRDGCGQGNDTLGAHLERK
eukprot:2196308-Rhodomonas_salina.1